MERHTMPQPTHCLADAAQTILPEIAHRTDHRQAPMLIALDGGSGAGKSTLAILLERQDARHAHVATREDLIVELA
jgi:pantothenate kinase-related protein Tda10